MTDGVSTTVTGAVPGLEIKEGGLGSRAQSAALATLCLVLFLTFLDNTVVSVGLADVQSSLHAGITSLQWVVNGYALTFAAFMLAGGTLGDILGRKKVMLAGVAVFCAGSVVAATAPNVDVLIGGRVIMGLGAAASEPGTLSIIRHVYPDRRTRADALGVWAAVSGLALALGPVIGGVLVGLWSWHAIFWFNLLFGAVAFLMALLFVPETSDRGSRADRLARDHAGRARARPPPPSGSFKGSSRATSHGGSTRASPPRSSSASSSSLPSTGSGVPSSTSRCSARRPSRGRSSSPSPPTSGPSPSSSSPPCTSKWW